MVTKRIGHGCCAFGQSSERESGQCLATSQAPLMYGDIFSYWEEIASDQHVHPRDERVFARRPDHGFELGCLPSAYMGPLKNAPVVLLYLSPGLSPFDLEDAQSQAGQLRYQNQRTGTALLPSRGEHESAWKWWTSRTRSLGDEEGVRGNVAILNIGAYHSTSFADWALLCALPSSRKSLEWAQEVLFPEAEKGDRIVICLRAARYWGLQVREQPHGKALFAPRTNKGGYMLKGGARERVIAAAREAIKTKRP